MTSQTIISAPVVRPKLSRAKRRQKTHLKLIELYKQNECLWKETDKDFFNIEHKECVWEDIAEQMASNPAKAYPEKWKGVIHKLRYKVQLDQLRADQAKLFKAPLDELPQKPLYAAHLDFLSKKFDRKSKKPALANLDSVSLASCASKQPESLAAKCMRLGRNQFKKCASMTQKLKSLEDLRNSNCSMMSLTHEALHKLKN
ncbi:uncharacterized protein LOC108608246 [Drosophila busckii]|uniref:uncharacterized protein LOC108608246 n=1 Tax=Drosophila busckii TaxID=30019 RepID=UPI001432CE0A|nr:uncharacterized protein LOC108608246 [Drosophila busckii]